MKIIETRIYAGLMILTDYILLGLLWIIMSLPLLTLIPATCGVFHVLHSWEEGESGRILSLFFQGFRRKLLQTSSLSMGYIVFLGTVYLGFSVIAEAGTDLKMVIGLLLAAVFLVTVFLLRLFYLFTADGNRSLASQLEAAAVQLVVGLPQTIGLILTSILYAWLVYLFPPFLFVLAGGFWKVVYWLAGKNNE